MTEKELVLHFGELLVPTGSRGSAVGWGTALQAGR